MIYGIESKVFSFEKQQDWQLKLASSGIALNNFLP